MDVKFRIVNGGIMAYVMRRGMITSAVDATEDRAAEKLRHYIAIINNHGHDAAMAYMDATYEEMKNGDESPSAVSAYVSRAFREGRIVKG